PSCGQTAHPHRLDMGHILHEMVHVFTHADKGIFYLTKAMFRRPGLVAKDYVEGRRQQYFNPFSYLVLTVAVAAFLSNYFHLMDTSAPGEHIRPGEALVAKNINLVFLIAAPIGAFFNWLLFWRSRYNYAENLTLQAFLGGFRVVFFLFIFTPLVLLFREKYYLMLTIYLGMWSVFLTWANLQFYGGRWWLVALKTVVSLLLTQVVITMLIYIILRWIL
ncbi:MAG: DUF3667 domain-containing protein, partial [Saprospiraceae bacterium]